MKVNPEIGSVVNIVNKDKDTQNQKKTKDASSQDQIADVVSVENKQASRSRVENVDEAKQILSNVTKDMGKSSSGLYNLDYQSVSKVIS